MRESVRSMPGFENANVADYDGFVDFLMPTLDCFAAAIKDPYYQEVVGPDESNFADLAKTRVMVGWEEVYVDNGKVVDVKPGELNPTMEKPGRHRRSRMPQDVRRRILAAQGSQAPSYHRPTSHEAYSPVLTA